MPAEPGYAQIKRWFGGQVGVGARNAPTFQDVRLYPEEEALLSANASRKRRMEFALGRVASRDALLDLGSAPAPILRGSHGEPLWPPGVVGSITHSRGIAIAVVARYHRIRGVGIDLERRVQELTYGHVHRICTRCERMWVMSTDHIQHIRLKMLFSAKEAVFKAFFPRESQYLDFKDVCLHWDEIIQGFHGILCKYQGSRYARGFRFLVRCHVYESAIFSWTILHV